jgi:hypothetical protein
MSVLKIVTSIPPPTWIPPKVAFISIVEPSPAWIGNVEVNREESPLMTVFLMTNLHAGARADHDAPSCRT